jgi:DNA polymerase
MKLRKIKVLRALGVDVYRPKAGSADDLNQASEDERRESHPVAVPGAIALPAGGDLKPQAEVVVMPLPPRAVVATHGAARVIPQDWQGLAAMVKDCQHCKLCETRTQTVFGTGPETAPLMIVGEGPGADEDASGQPFVGRAGKLLDEMLQAIGQSRSSNTYITNVVKCRPPSNRDPEKDEVDGCRAYLDAQIALLKPKLIVALGRVAAQRLLSNDEALSKLRGPVHHYGALATPVMVTYHPAYLLRSPREKAKSWEDLKKVWQFLQPAA